MTTADCFFKNNFSLHFPVLDTTSPFDEKFHLKFRFCSKVIVVWHPPASTTGRLGRTVFHTTPSVRTLLLRNALYFADMIKRENSRSSDRPKRLGKFGALLSFRSCLFFLFLSKVCSIALSLDRTCECVCDYAVWKTGLNVDYILVAFMRCHWV